MPLQVAGKQQYRSRENNVKKMTHTNGNDVKTKYGVINIISELRFKSKYRIIQYS